jgi:hypothetical protein
MPHQDASHLFSIFGFVLWGDFGPTTLYRNKKGKIVFYAKTWPHKPPSPKQTQQRALFTAAATAWQTLSQTQRDQWELATLRASLCMHGYDLWVHWYTTQDTLAIQTLQRQTATSLLP